MKSACWKVGCGDHMTTWVAREPRRAVDCFQRARKAGALKGRLWHVMIVPPLGTLEPTEEGYDAFKRDAYRIYEAHGLRGGCVVGHYCQKTHPGVYWPHVHAIGPVYDRYKPGPYCVPCGGPASPSCKEDRHETWVIKFVKVRGKGLMRQVAAILRYELGHALRRQGRHALTWFGTLSNGKRKTWGPPEAVDPQEYVAPRCPEHGCELVPSAPWDSTNYDRLLALRDRPPPEDVWDE